MRIYTPACRTEDWFLTIFYREVGRPQPVRVGRDLGQFGHGAEHMDRVGMTQMELHRNSASVELFPGARILAVVCSPEKKIDKRFAESLTLRDEVELANPYDMINVSPELASEMKGENTDIVKRQLEVMNGKRKTFYGK